METLVFLNDEEVVELSDGTHWCIAYDQLPKTQRWLKGAKTTSSASSSCCSVSPPA